MRHGITGHVEQYHDDGERTANSYHILWRVTILCNGHGDSDTQTGTAGGTFTVSPSQPDHQLNNRGYQLGHKLSEYLHDNITHSAMGPVQIPLLPRQRLMLVPTATISYGGSPYCTTGTATVTQTGTAGGVIYRHHQPVRCPSTRQRGDASPMGTSSANTYTVTYTFRQCGLFKFQTNPSSVVITQRCLRGTRSSYAGIPILL